MITIKRLLVLNRGSDPREAFTGSLARLPDSVNRCRCCKRKVGRPPLEIPALILIADESDENPQTVYSVVCERCSSRVTPRKIIATALEGLVDMYGGLDIPDMHAPGHA